jgi:hypothetical protein
MNGETLKCILIGGALSVFILVGALAESSNRAYDAKYVEHLREVAVASEPLSTRLSEGPAYREYLTSGKFPGRVRYWTMLETTNWVFLNPRFGGDTCPVLNQFVRKDEGGSLPTEEQLALVAVAFRDKSVDLQGYVPRFTQRPKSLDRCLGYGFDAERGVLTLGGKPVALLANQQPGLRL